MTDLAHFGQPSVFGGLRTVPEPSPGGFTRSAVHAVVIVAAVLAVTALGAVAAVSGVVWAVVQALDESD